MAKNFVEQLDNLQEKWFDPKYDELDYIGGIDNFLNNNVFTYASVRPWLYEPMESDKNPYPLFARVRVGCGPCKSFFRVLRLKLNYEWRRRYLHTREDRKKDWFVMVKNEIEF